MSQFGGYYRRQAYNLDAEIIALRVELTAIREERDALAATMESLIFDMRKFAVEEERFGAVEFLDSLNMSKYLDLLAARDASQRKAGALYALRLVADDTWYASELIRAIERGEVKP